jgi:signal transduction histidine kinase
VARLSALRATGRGRGYCGADRRGLVRGMWSSNAGLLAALVAVSVACLPLAGVAVVATLPWLPLHAWLSGFTDLAFVAFLVLAALLLLYWRLMGEAAAGPLAAASSVVALWVVPGLTRATAPRAGYTGVLRAVSIAAELGLCLYATRLPEVQAGLRPGRFICLALAGTALLAWVVSSTPLTAVLGWRLGPLRCVDAGETAVCLAMALALFVWGARSGRPLFVGAGTIALCLAGATLALSIPSSSLAGPWVCLPSLFLLVGAGGQLVAVGACVQSAVDRVVLKDLRGRRRWEAAETQLAQARHNYQGQRHDIHSMLSAVDGTLLVLAHQRDSLPAQEVDRLMNAVRDEVRELRQLLSPEASSSRPYDLSHLLGTIVAVRATAGCRVVPALEPGLMVQGRPDRLAVVVDNLLANAALHGGGGEMAITARRGARGGRDVVEIAVSDLGPGLSEQEQGQAFQRGWRCGQSESFPGSGLGLYQCRQLLDAEGGSIDLGPTDPAALPGRRGLTARVTIPVHRARHG